MPIVHDSKQSLPDPCLITLEKTVKIQITYERNEKLRHFLVSTPLIIKIQMRNQRLVEQLREKSAQFSKLQFHVHKLDNQIDCLTRRCALSEALDKLTFDERLIQRSASIFEKMEDRLKEFRNQMQNAKLDAVNIQQMVSMRIYLLIQVSHCIYEFSLDTFSYTSKNYLVKSECNDPSLKRKLDMMPCYEALYSFTNGVVRKLNEMRWSLLEKAADASRAEIDLITTQSSLLITHAQIERLRIKLRATTRYKRPASFHGENLLDRIVSMNVQLEKSSNRPVSRIEHMMREMSNNNRNRTKMTLPLPREKAKEAVRRPIRLTNENGVLDKVITSLQDVTTLRSSTTTPIMGRRVDRRPTIYDIVLDTPSRIEKVRKQERGYSTDTRNDDRSNCERNEIWLREDCLKDREERSRDEKRLSCIDGDRKQWKIQRSQPVHLTRIRPPSQSTTQTKAVGYLHFPLVLLSYRSLTVSNWRLSASIRCTAVTQRFSIGFRSEEHDSQSIVSTSLYSNQVLVL
uniref:DUF4708 domain-containing protein n=1 Tax=Heterorhabditis bacteriophora TaxID=37862 RepID=A0A1I7X2S9_HETBA